MPALFPSDLYFHISDEVQAALADERAVVALESTVIAHGLSHPVNLEVARRMEAVIREVGTVPATVGIIEGRLTVGLSEDQLVLMATADDIRKASVRDLSILAASKGNGATTVATTALAAHRAGIRVFATGGIGGVHRGNAGDVSADLPTLARTPVAVVCAGAKSILDLPRTREWLETHGVPVIGYQTDELPAFYAARSGLAVDTRADNPEDVATILNVHFDMAAPGGVLIGVPPPAEVALSDEEMEAAIEQAVGEAERKGIGGKQLTPFLLGRVADVTAGRSQTVNVALVENNARVAAQVARAMV